METLFNGYTLEIAPGTFPLSTDSMALAEFVKLPKQARVLDLGAGCGTLGILLCARDSSCHVTGVELDATAHVTAEENRAANDLQDRFHCVCGDLTAVKEWAVPGSFDVCISNPPYFNAGFLSRSTPLARHELGCTLDALMASAAYCLKFGGDFFLVHKPERLAEIFAAAGSHKLEPKRLCLLHHKEGGPVSLVLIQCRKGAKPGLSWESESLHHPDGQTTDYYRKIYHL